MRRILLGGIAVVLGAYATPAAGQDARTNPPQQHQRVAKLGIAGHPGDLPVERSGAGTAHLNMLEARRRHFGLHCIRTRHPDGDAAAGAIDRQGDTARSAPALLQANRG